MGLNYSARLEATKSISGSLDVDIPYLDELLSALRLKSYDAISLRKLFYDISSHNKVLCASKVLLFFGLESSEFFIKIFTNYNNHSRLGLCFQEFLVSLWSFCSLQNEYLGILLPEKFLLVSDDFCLVEFVFSHYDDDNR